MTKRKVQDIAPQNLDAEQSVLACCMLGGGKVDAVRQILKPEDFFSDINQKVYQRILEVADRTNGDVDIVMVANALQASGEFEEIGGTIYLREVLESVPYHDHAIHYAQLVIDCSKRRQAMRIGEELIERARDLSNDSHDVVESAHDAAMKMAELLHVKNSYPRPLSEHVTEAVETYRTGRSPAQFWGIPEIDEAIGGVMPGELVVIGARPSIGKTMLELQWIDCAARRGVPGLIISEEMSAASLANRSLSSITNIPSNEWTQSVDRIAFDVREHFANRADVLIAEKCATIAAAERAIGRAVQSHGIRIVAVDYAQLLQGNGDSTEQQIADVSKRLKCAAMRHDIVVILLAQLNRQIETRPGATPQLSDLRGSGGLEQDADVALFPYWPWKVNDSYADPSEYRIYIRKNRNRGIGEHFVQMRINPSRQRLEGIADVPFNAVDEWEASSR